MQAKWVIMSLQNADFFNVRLSSFNIKWETETRLHQMHTVSHTMASTVAHSSGHKTLSRTRSSTSAPSAGTDARLMASNARSAAGRMRSGKASRRTARSRHVRPTNSEWSGDLCSVTMSFAFHCLTTKEEKIKLKYEYHYDL